MSIAHYRFLYGSGSVWKSLFIMQYLWTPPLIYLSPAFPCRWWHGSLVSYGVKISPSHDKHRKHSLITVLFPSPVQVVQFSARPITAANRPSSPTIPVCCTDSAKPYTLYTWQKFVIIDTCHEPIFVVLKINSHIRNLEILIVNT